MVGQNDRSMEPPPAKLHKQAPAARAEDKPPGKTSFGTLPSVQNNVFNVSIEFPKDSEHPLRDRISALFATMQKGDNQLALLPRDTTAKLNPITTSASVPYSPDNFEQYVTKPTFGNTTIKVFITLQSSMTFNRLKFAPHVFNYLTKYKIWMKSHLISSDKVIPMAWLYHTNPNHTSKFELRDKIQSTLPADFPQFQINRRTIRYSLDKTLTTDAWCIEIDGTNTGQAFSTLLHTLPLSGPHGAVPMNSSTDTEDKIRNLFLSHNEHLHNTISIRVDNLKSLNVPLKKTDGTMIISIHDEVLSWKTTDGKPLFISMSQYNSKRVNFLCDKKNEVLARDQLKTYVNYLMTELDSDFLHEYFCDSDPLVVGLNPVPQHISVFLNGINNNDIPTFTMDDASLTTNKQPPSSRKRPSSYSQAAQSNMNQTVNTESTTNPGGASEITQTTQAASQVAYESRINQAMEAMRAKTIEITKAHTTLTDRITTVTNQFQEMQKRFEETIQHVSNMQTSMTKMQQSMDSQYKTLLAAIQTQRSTQPAYQQAPPTYQQHQTHQPSQPLLTPLTTQDLQTQMETDTPATYDPGENTRRQE